MTFKATLTTDERFWLKVDDAGDPQGCWLWTGYLSRNGYGRFRLTSTPRPGVVIQAHQYLAGRAQDGMEWDHLCRNHNCVRPDHLEQVTHAVNIRRIPAYSRGNAEKTHCKRNHQFTDSNTTVRPDGSRQCRACDNQRRRASHASKTHQEPRKETYTQ